MVLFFTDSLSKCVFSKPFVLKEDVLQVLRIRSEEAGDVIILPEDHHLTFFNGPFMETINDMSSEDLSLFVEFCTGYNYLPHDEKFINQPDVFLKLVKNRQDGTELDFGLYFHKDSMQFTSREGRAMPLEGTVDDY